MLLDRSILEFLSTGREEGLLFFLFSLVVDLYGLYSLGVEVSPKISELRLQAKSLLWKYEKLAQKNKIQSLIAIGYLRRYMADLSSEVRLARLAKEYRYEMKLGRRPDLIIDGKGIEVKRVRTRPVTHRQLSCLLRMCPLENPSMSQS